MPRFYPALVGKSGAFIFYAKKILSKGLAGVNGHINEWEYLSLVTNQIFFLNKYV
jgi:hypothetical protein